MTTYLSPQQATASRLAARGLSNTEIAAQMGIAYGTVKIHLHNALVRTGARNRVELILMVERGEIELAPPGNRFGLVRGQPVKIVGGLYFGRAATFIRVASSKQVLVTIGAGQIAVTARFVEPAREAA